MPQVSDRVPTLRFEARSAGRAGIASFPFGPFTLHRLHGVPIER